MSTLESEGKKRGRYKVYLEGDDWDAEVPIRSRYRYDEEQFIPTTRSSTVQGRSQDLGGNDHPGVDDRDIEGERADFSDDQISEVSAPKISSFCDAHMSICEDHEKQPNVSSSESGESADAHDESIEFPVIEQTSSLTQDNSEEIDFANAETMAVHIAPAPSHLTLEDPIFELLRTESNRDDSADEEQELAPQVIGDDEEDLTCNLFDTDDNQAEINVENAGCELLDAPQDQLEESSQIQEQFLQDHKELWKTVGSDKFTSPISTPVCASPAEAILMTLGISQQNNLSFKAFLDSVKLLNSLFVSPVIPNSQYLLDKLLLCESGIVRYFYCSKCTFSFGNVDHEKHPNQLCPECKTNNYIKDLTKATYFVLYDLIPQIALLFMDDKIWESLIDPREAVKQNQPNVLTDIYSGKCSKEFAASLPDYPGETIISFNMCALFKSSTFSIWPSFFSIDELPPLLRMKNLLLGGLWFGNRHPPMDLYLEPLVHHLKSLSDQGFMIHNHRKMRAFTLGCCVDSGARGAMQGTNSHSGYYSCNWCEIPGEYFEHKVVFPFQENPSKLRTHNNLIEQATQCVNDKKLFYVYGAQFVTPLARLPKFDIVQGMVQDFLHNVPFGIGRTFLEEWLTNAKTISG